jgi:DNA-binding protein
LEENISQFKKDSVKVHIKTQGHLLNQAVISLEIYHNFFYSDKISLNGLAE